MKKTVKFSKNEINTLINSTKDELIKEIRHELFEKLSIKKIDIELTLAEKMFIEEALREMYIKLANEKRYLPLLNSIWQKLDI